MNELPLNWSLVKLVEMLEGYQAGFASGEKNIENGLKHLRVNNISVNGKLDLELLRKVPSCLAKEYHYLKKGDLLICTTNSAKLVGKSAIFNLEGDFAFSNHLTRLRLHSEIGNTQFLQFYLWSLWQKGQFEMLCKHWVNQSTIPKDKLLALEVPLPPLNEQHRIVAKLEQLLSRVQSCQERLDRIDDIKNRIVQSFLYQNSFLCAMVCLKDYCEEKTTSVGQNWAKYPQIGVNNAIGIVPLRAGGKKSFERYKIVFPGDFIYNPMRVNIGSIAIYEGSSIAITSPDYVVFRVQHTISSHLLLKFLKSPLGLNEINKNTQGSVRSRLYFKGLKKIKFPMADKDKQIQAELLLKIFTKWGSRKEQLQKILDQLTQSILAKAFRGELVPQDPNDEPSEVLLERIRKERAGQEKSSGKKCRKTKA